MVANVGARFRTILHANNDHKGMIFNEPVFRQYIKETMYSAIDDKLYWVEYRILFLNRQAMAHRQRSFD